MKILFMGTPDFAEASLKALIDSENEIVGVFTRPDKPVGRGMKMSCPPVKELAQKIGIPVFQPTKLRDGTALEIIKKLQPELIVVVAYGMLLPDDILNFPKYGCINIHGSILPKYRGAAPIQWSVINGDKETGVTAMYMATELDAGDIIEISRTPIGERETAGELFDRLADMGAQLLIKTVSDIEHGTALRTPQNHADATYAPQLTKEMAEINWDNEADKVISFIYGMNPWPVAFSDIGGTRFKVYKAEKGTGAPNTAPGTLVSAGNKGIEIAVKGGTVIITELQAAGGKRMAAADYLRGHPLKV